MQTENWVNALVHMTRYGIHSNSPNEANFEVVSKSPVHLSAIPTLTLSQFKTEAVKLF